jgi:hypothetical protein
MAKNDIKIKINVDGKDIELTKKQAEKLGKQLDNTGKSTNKLGKETDKTTYATKKGINATANGTKNFSNMARGISGGLVPAYATLAANVFALTAVFGFLTKAADYRVLQQGQAAYAAVTGVAYKTLTNTIIEATDAQITYADAAQAAAIGTAAGLSPEQLGKLGEAAKTVSIALGRDLTDSFNRLIRGTTKAEPELLDELGIILRLETATKNYAASLGVTKESLNAFQRTQAVTVDVLTQVETKFAAINAIMDPETNKINKLSKAFDDLMNTVRSLVAGPAEGLAVFFSENIGAAIGALGLFTLPIIKSILPAFEDWEKTAKAKLAGHDAAIAKSSRRLKAYAKLQQMNRDKAMAAPVSKLKNLSAGLDAKPGTGLAAMQSGAGYGTGPGQISKRQLANMKAQAKKGIGIFRNMDKTIKAGWINAMNEMATSTKVSLGTKVKVSVTNMTLTFQKAGLMIKAGWQAAMTGVQAASALAASAVSKVFGFLSFISIAILAFEGIKLGLKKFGMLEGAADGANTALGKLTRTQKELNKELQNMLNADEKLAAEGLALTMNQLIKRQGERLTSAALGPSFKALAENKRKQQELIDRGATKTGAAGAGSLETNNPYAINSGIAVGGMDTLNKELNDLVNAETEFTEKFVKRISILSETFSEFDGIVVDGKIVVDDLSEAQYKLIDSYTAGAAAVKFLEQSEASYQQTLQGRFGQMSKERASLKQAEAQLEGYDTTIASPEFGLDQSIAGLLAQEAFMDKRNKAVGQVSAMSAADTGVRAQKVIQDQIKLEHQLSKNRIDGATILGQRRKVLLDITQKQSQIDALRVKITEQQTLLDSAPDKVAAQRGIEDLEAQVVLLGKQKEGLIGSIDATKQLGVAATNAFANGLQKGIQGVIEGTMSLKEAFLSMTKSILSAIAQILAKQAALAIMGVVMPGAGPGSREGGILKSPGYRSFATGGVADGPNSGYAATLHGTEAVVPLPNGRSIPVEMSGGAGANNVSVNVNMTTGQSSSTGDGEQAYALGRAISTAVQTELEKQQRPGGALSPY